MRPQDKIIFASAAADPPLKLWILVRRTNPKSLRYIARKGFTPKRIDCKAKTADEGDVAGLVVDAEIHKTSFKSGKAEDALKYWKAFVREVLSKPDSGYTVQMNKESGYYGCVMLDGNYVHADYDLYDLIDPRTAQDNPALDEVLLGQPHRRGPFLGHVQEFINSRIGVPMVQHGGEAQFKDHSAQPIDAFGPNREECTILNEYSVRAWYRDRFRGRRAGK